MMTDINNADTTVSTAETTEIEKVDESPIEEKEETIEEPSHDPIKKELEKVENRGKGRSELEKAIFTKRQIEKRIAELKGETGQEEIPESEDENTPVTIAMLKKLEKDKAVTTAKSLADDRIQDENERKLTQYHLDNTIRPSGNAEEDLRNARAIVNSIKNAQIAEEAVRKTAPRRTGAGGSAPAKHEDAFEPTAEEQTFMNARGLDGKPLMTKEDILKARKAAQK